MAERSVSPKCKEWQPKKLSLLTKSTTACMHVSALYARTPLPTTIQSTTATTPSFARAHARAGCTGVVLAWWNRFSSHLRGQVNLSSTPTVNYKHMKRRLMNWNLYQLGALRAELSQLKSTNSTQCNSPSNLPCSTPLSEVNNNPVGPSYSSILQSSNNNVARPNPVHATTVTSRMQVQYCCLWPK